MIFGKGQPCQRMLMEEVHNYPWRGVEEIVMNNQDLLIYEEIFTELRKGHAAFTLIFK
jgi:hypothetical protein